MRRRRVQEKFRAVNSGLRSGSAAGQASRAAPRPAAGGRRAPILRSSSCSFAVPAWRVQRPRPGLCRARGSPAPPRAPPALPAGPASLDQVRSRASLYRDALLGPPPQVGAGAPGPIGSPALTPSFAYPHGNRSPAVNLLRETAVGRGGDGPPARGVGRAPWWPPRGTAQRRARDQASDFCHRALRSQDCTARVW